MKTTFLAVPAGAGWTNVVATIPAHTIRAIGDESPLATNWEVQWPEDSFTHIYEYAAGIPIERNGAGHQGILQPPPGYFAEHQPVTGGIYFKIRDKAGIGGTIRLIESETELSTTLT